uniref:Third variable lymphocyte receptor n=1 Tax=Eptatretus stoutii TaxID=7765 RepID=T1YTK0_EPTST|nr:third variable lymphocyte receptor [Eptatretus stoutii]
MERWFSRITMFWMLFLGEVQSQDWTKCSTGCTCDGNKMSVTCNGLKNVPNDIQKDAKKLDLKYNSLSKLDPTAFHGLNKLTNLDLQWNKLQALPVGVFDHLVSLDKLVLNQNQLKSLPPKIFDSLTKLTWLNLERNKLQSLPNGVFHNLPLLKELHLNNNQLRRVPEGVFDKLTQLGTLYLNDNQLKSLPDGVFDKLSQLQKLYLHENQLRSVPDKAFEKLSKLETITLYANDWDCESCDILYLSQWIRVNAEKVKNFLTGQNDLPDPDGVTCQGTMESVNKITKENTFQAGCPTTTQQMATSPASTTTTETMTVREKQTKPRMKIFQEELFSKASIFFCQVIFTQHVSLVVIHILAEIPLLHIVCVVRKP